VFRLKKSPFEASAELVEVGDLGGCKIKALPKSSPLFSKRGVRPGGRGVG
tara:strand:- start:861 stop:1010 length:150 start_codon:yes stop_codon:yes gene_type:complete